MTGWVVLADGRVKGTTSKGGSASRRSRRASSRAEGLDGSVPDQVPAEPAREARVGFHVLQARTAPAAEVRARQALRPAARGKPLEACRRNPRSRLPLCRPDSRLGGSSRSSEVRSTVSGPTGRPATPLRASTGARPMTPNSDRSPRRSCRTRSSSRPPSGSERPRSRVYARQRLRPPKRSSCRLCRARTSRNSRPSPGARTCSSPGIRSHVPRPTRGRRQDRIRRAGSD